MNLNDVLVSDCELAAVLYIMKCKDELRQTESKILRTSSFEGLCAFSDQASIIRRDEDAAYDYFAKLVVKRKPAHQVQYQLWIRRIESMPREEKNKMLEAFEHNQDLSPWMLKIK